MSSRVDLGTVIRLSERQISCDLGSEEVILNVDAGIYYGLNEVGKRIWELLSEPRSLSEILEILLDEYEVTRALCERDLIRIVGELQSHGLIEIDQA